MKYRIYLAILCFILSLMPFSAAAGEIYLWTDEQGVSHITDYPPEKSERVINREKFREMSPQEIRRYEELRKLNQQISEQRDGHQRQMNELEAKLGKAREERIEREKADLKARLEKARRNVDDLEALKERYQRHGNNAHSESARLYWKDEIRKIDRALKDNKEFLNKNTWP